MTSAIELHGPPHVQRYLDAWPDYDEYQKKTDREIPVVVLERKA